MDLEISLYLALLKLKDAIDNVMKDDPLSHKQWTYLEREYAEAERVLKEFEREYRFNRYE